MAQIFLVFIFLLPFLYFIFKKLKSSSKKNIPPFPPGPTPWPLIGNIPHMATKMPHIALSDFSKIHGPLIMIRLGTHKIVVASSPAAAREIFTRHDQLLSLRYVPNCIIHNQDFLNKCSHAWAETTSDGWKLGRTLTRAELSSSKSLDAQSFIREKKISQMIDHVKTRNKGDTINIQELAFTTAFNMLSNVLMSRDLIKYDEEKNGNGGVKGLIREMFEITLAPNLSDFYPILSRFDLQGIRKKSAKIIMKFIAIFEPIIQQRRMEMEKEMAPMGQNDYLDILLLNNFTDLQIQNVIMELITAGADTSTSAVEWAMAELIKSPKSMTKVIEELDKVVGKDIVNESHLFKLSYLEACIKETLRLHPPAPILLPRRAPETCQVLNYTIPKDAQLHINVWAMGRDPLLWDEPMLFRPERFLNSTLDYIENDFEFIPFGGGRRICPGLPIAKRQVSLVLAVLLHSFDWSLPDGMVSQELDMTEKFGVSLLKDQPLLLIPKLRKCE